jgi:hypothetical protein
MARIGYAPTAVSGAASTRTVDEAESMLEQWFARPVVLTSSGRAALLLALQALGLQRYRHRVAISPKTAQCVFDAVTRAAFPVDPATDRGHADATVLIHQYGHLQQDRPHGPVIEDICHAFFASAHTGTREWAGDLAVFSLPKFLSLPGMAGGIVAADHALATDLRQRRDAATRLAPAQISADQASWRDGDAAQIEHVYLRALLHPSCAEAVLGSLPHDLSALQQLGARRQAVTRVMLQAIPADQLDPDWRAMCAASLPFALPVFGDDARLAALVEAARALGFEAGLYQIDRSRRMASPDYAQAVLLPCHEQIGADALSALCAAIRRCGEGVRP